MSLAGLQPLFLQPRDECPTFQQLNGMTRVGFEPTTYGLKVITGP